VSERKEPKVGTMGPKPKGTFSEYTAKEAASALKSPSKEHDFRGLLDPNVVPDDRLKNAEKKAGFAKGGQVRGCGCATKGHGKMRVL